MEEKFRKAMVANAGLDNEKQQLTYQVDLLKDRLEESEEQSALVAKELREKSRDFELLKRSYAEAQRAVQLLQVFKQISFCHSFLNPDLSLKAQMDEQARLLAERGMVLVGGVDDEDEEGAATNGHATNGVAEVDAEEQEARTRAIVSSETATILSGLGPGPLDVRIKRLADDRDDLQVR